MHKHRSSFQLLASVRARADSGVLGLLTRSFGSRFSKGSFGKEDRPSENFSFPRHKELFTEDYYNNEYREGYDPDKEWENHMESPITKNLRANSHHYQHDQADVGFQRTEQTVSGGILKNYKQVRKETLGDILHGDYWRANKNYMKEAAKSFTLESSSEKEMMDYTKNFTTRHRLSRDIDFTEDFRKKYLTKEYGNFEKYEKNSVTLEVDKGEQRTNKDKFTELYTKFLRRMPTGESEYIKQKEAKDLREMFDRNKENKQELAKNYF